LIRSIIRLTEILINQPSDEISISLDGSRTFIILIGWKILYENWIKYIIFSKGYTRNRRDNEKTSTHVQVKREPTSIEEQKKQLWSKTNATKRAQAKSALSVQ